MKTPRQLFCLLALLSVCHLSNAIERNAVTLDSRMTHGGAQVWRMHRADELQAAAAQISAPGFDMSSWMEAGVPGTVLTNLVANGVYEDPYYGLNNKLSENRIPDISKVGREFYTYWFRTEFTAPQYGKGERLWLEPQGINYRAEIWLNGRLIDVMAGMFNSDPIDITEFVKPGEACALAVKVYPVDVPGTTMPKTWGATNEWHNGGDGQIGWNVTQLMTVGWDFSFEDGIRDRNTGIWKSILLYTTGAAKLSSPMVRSELSHPNYDKSAETVSVEVANASRETIDCRVEGVIEGTDIRVSKDIHLLRGENKEMVFSPDEFPQLKMDNPRLWWPKNKGPQNLYTINLSVSIKDKKTEAYAKSDEISSRFGIREVVAVRDTPDHSKLFVINGHRTFVRGTNWLPEAMLRTDDSRMEAEMAYTDQSGVNFIRLWGGGIAESDRFYELCDEYGLMVWQEFWMTGDTIHPHDRSLYFTNMESTVKRLRNHPSIVFWVSSNESTEMSGAEELLQRLDGTRPYQSQSETDGVHDGSPYKQVNPMQHYENTASSRGSRVDGFNPEYGAPTLPIVEDLRKMMPAEDLWPMNKTVWNYLDGNGFHLMSTLYTDMTNEYGESGSIEEFARKGQLVGAMNSKSIWEVWNENKLGYGDRFCSGLLFWYHNCANVQVCARMWDWWLEPTASLYHTMHSLEPVHVQFDYLKNSVSVINDYIESQNGMEVTAQVYDSRSRLLLTRTASVDVPSDGVANDVITLKFPSSVTPVHFVVLTLKDKDGKTVSRNIYWRSKNVYKGAETLTGPCTAGFQTLAKLPAANPSVEAVETAPQNGRRIWKVTVSNPSTRMAFFCQILLLDKDGEPVHRTIYSDNFITLLPGETQELSVCAPAGLEGGCTFKFAEALNPETFVTPSAN